MPQTEASPSRRGPNANTEIPSYVVNFNVAPVAAMDVANITTPSNKIGRLRRIVLVNPGNATAAAIATLQLGYADSFGSGGAAATIRSLDVPARPAGVIGGPEADASGGSARTGDTTLAGNFVALYDPVATIQVPTAAAAFTPTTIYDARDARFKALTVNGGNPAGAKTFVLRISAVGAGATGFRGYAEFTVDDV